MGKGALPPLGRRRMEKGELAFSGAKAKSTAMLRRYKSKKKKKKKTENY